MSTRKSHSYIPFYMNDWAAGTMHMTRLVKSVYFEVCFYNWDKVKPVSEARLKLMLADLERNGMMIIDALVEDESLTRNPDGSVYSKRALAEAQKAFDLWEKKSKGGKTRQAERPAEPQESSQDSSTEQDQDQDQDQESPNGDEDTDKSVSVGKKPTPADRWLVLDAWNKMAGPNGLATVQKLNESRSKALNAAIGEYGTEKIIEAIARVPDNDFLMGRAGNGTWKANLDDLMRAKNRGKFVEGGYEQGEGKQSAWR